MPIPLIVPAVAVCCAFTAPVVGMAAAGGNPGRPEVQNPNGLSDWIDRTFGFNGPQQRRAEAPQYEYMEAVDEGASVQEERAPERMLMGADRSSEQSTNAAAYNAQNAVYYDADSARDTGSASWSVPYVKPPVGTAPLSSMRM
eukprot:Tamp_24816.p1 GENE.Tamp_24816~~Tamp_24816.p1  ORF type:complete len:153 (-),score=22.33 Tamp_24816:513-941(-)